MTSILITTCLLIIGLLFTTPVAPKEEPWHTPAPTASAVSASSHAATLYAGENFGDITGSAPPSTEPPVSVGLTNSTSAMASSPPTTELTPQELVDSIFGWPGRQLVQCESGWNQWAVGPYMERGLFQVAPLWRPVVEQLGWSWDDMFQVEPNIRMAAHIRKVQGLRAWTCWRG